MVGYTFNINTTLWDIMSHTQKRIVPKPVGFNASALERDQKYKSLYGHSENMYFQGLSTPCTTIILIGLLRVLF